MPLQRGPPNSEDPTLDQIGGAHALNGRQRAIAAGRCPSIMMQAGTANASAATEGTRMVEGEQQRHQEQNARNGNREGGNAEIGVGPHPMPWPAGDRFDPELLRNGDRRNVVDRYRYWNVAAIVADLDTRRHPFHVAIENWHHDRNIGTVVRTANAFCAARVHIVGRRRWNRRGAMMTEVYQHLQHHAGVDKLAAWAHGEGLPLIGVDNLPGASPLEEVELPERCVLLFGQEGPGLSPEASGAVSLLVAISQYGSTRSLNAGVAAGIAMHAWVRRWALPDGIRH